MRAIAFFEVTEVSHHTVLTIIGDLINALQYLTIRNKMLHLL